MSAEAGASTTETAADEPLLPLVYRVNDLREAVGAPPMPEQIRAPRSAPSDDSDDDDEGGAKRRNRKLMLVVSASLVVGGGIAALAVLGHINAAKLVLTCEAKEAVAEQGRAFPPWGTSRLGGDEWKPIPISPSTQCAELETEKLATLSDAFRGLLVARAEALLGAREVVQIDEAAAILEQALLHARSDSEDHTTVRQRIQRMLGDVSYWRASAKLRDAATALTDAAKELETAAAQPPRFVSDANAWATHVRRLIEELRAGPGGTKPAAAAPAPPPSERPPAPPGVALPVEPGAGSAGSASEAPPPPPDAGVPTGGVLL